MEVFPGFNIQYPEYSVVTPQTMEQYTVRTLNVSEEENLKTSLVTPNKLAEHLNRALWSCIVKKPENVKTYEDFLAKTTLKDRDALLYGLYHITYKDLRNYDITCGTCSESYPVTLEISKAFNMTAYDPNAETPMIEKRVKVPLQVAQNVTAVIRQPTLLHEKDLLSDILFQSDKNLETGTEILAIERFEIEVPESKTPEAIVERDNILTGFRQLPAPDRKLITEQYVENFGKYQIELKMTSRCNHCGAENEGEINLFQQFFRSLF